jgi:hypothetical protein
MKLDELKEEEMYLFLAPDGSCQLATLARDFAMCMGIAELMALHGLGKSPSEMFDQGFEIIPVKVTVVQNGTADEGFQKAKKMMR